VASKHEPRATQGSWRHFGCVSAISKPAAWREANRERGGCLRKLGEARSAITDAIEAYEAKRWPLGKEPGGKG